MILANEITLHVMDMQGDFSWLPYETICYNLIVGMVNITYLYVICYKIHKLGIKVVIHWSMTKSVSFH